MSTTRTALIPKLLCTDIIVKGNHTDGPPNFKGLFRKAHQRVDLSTSTLASRRGNSIVVSSVESRFRWQGSLGI